ncbi:hypothetical protein [Candidatus Xianfuyuplasma coldseepsis]|uniref:Uncharacterized protein n=1 Tax=Candidatus Xianfuyuplasma coldseepsis TaxID=2782163 RepID=A0A7L7KP29_9MOLU|nr:hypothetical protein [Xianfuyuplasma coldseepsis]QMS84540.1 hypothetical protein G4Z02_01850 [Xianfuyuplasma coldseepsis]
MTRRMYIIGGIVVVTIITALTLILLNIFASDEPTEEAINFCEAYPETLFCEDDTATPMEIAVDLFTIVKDGYSAGYEEVFCEKFFYGNLETYCEEQPTILFPNDVISLNEYIQIREIEPNIFDIRTKYINDTRAYTFRLALNDSAGVYNISGISYTEWEPSPDLTLTDEDVHEFMLEMLDDSVDPGTFFCDDYFAYEANVTCRNATTLINHPDYQFNYIVEAAGLNTFNYTVSDEEETDTVTYHIVFEEFNETLYITRFSTN